MGVAYKLSCGNCSYAQNVFLGFGFRYTSLEFIYEWYKEESGRQQIQEFIDDKEASYNCFDGLYVCPGCRFVLNEVYLHMESGPKSYTNHYDCPRCAAPMPLYPLEDLDDILLNCPDCDGEKLEVAPYMDWD